MYLSWLLYKSLIAWKHFLWTMDGPHSSYSCLVIHICWKVEREAKMDPPIHTEYFLSGGAMILILMVDGAKAVISFCILSAIPGYMVVPPDMTVLAYKSLRMSTSHFMMELWVVSWTPQDSIPKKDGWKRASGARKRSLPMVITWPSGNSTLGGGGERVASLGEDLHEVVGELTASQVQTEDGVGESITFIDWDGVGYTITRVHDNTSGTSRSVEGKYSLDGNIHCWHVEGLEHDLGHLFTVSFWVEGSFSQEYGLLFWCNTELIIEGVMPDFLHIIPVGDDTVFNGVFQGKDTSLGLGFISDIGILLSHTYHDTLVTWASNDGWEDSSWGVITSKASFAHTRAIVYDKSGNVFVTHLGLLVFLIKIKMRQKSVSSTADDLRLPC